MKRKMFKEFAAHRIQTRIFLRYDRRKLQVEDKDIDNKNKIFAIATIDLQLGIIEEKTCEQRKQNTFRE